MSRGKATIELRKLCGHHSIIPTSYKLEGVVKQGELPQYRHPTGVTEVWKGRYNGGVVALKVLRVPLDDPLMRGIKSVSTSPDPLLVVILTDDVAVLQGGSGDDAAQA